MTKYINGHSDVVAGAVLGDAETITKIRHTLHSLGGALDPHAAFLVNRGVNTLALRVRHQSETALKIAQFLDAHAKIQRVSHPGLESHPDHKVAAELLDGFGAMVTFENRGRPRSGRGLFSCARHSDHRAEPGRTRNAGNTPRDHVTRWLVDSGARKPRHHRRPDPLLGRFGGCRRADRRFRPGPRLISVYHADLRSFQIIANVRMGCSDNGEIHESF